jgi:hypothetical protein
MRFTAGFPWFPTFFIHYPLVNVYKKLLNMAIEIVDLPMKNDDFQSYVSLPEGT